MCSIRNRLLAAGVVALAAWLAYLFLPHPSTPPRTASSAPPVVAPPESITPATPDTATHPSSASDSMVMLEFATELEQTLIHAENPDAHRQAVEQILFFYRRAFGENPVGQNDDITAALLGANPQRLALLPPGSPAIQNGQLIDPWGTPYWFHPLSGNEMEIRSAGPDRELFTPDDIGEGGEPERPDDT